MAPDRDVVKAQVIELLDWLSWKKTASEIKESDKLKSDLLLSTTLRRALAPGLQRIARQSKPTAVVRMKECEKLVTVKATIDLAVKRGTP